MGITFQEQKVPHKRHRICKDTKMIWESLRQTVFIWQKKHQKTTSLFYDSDLCISETLRHWRKFKYLYKDLQLIFNTQSILMQLTLVQTNTSISSSIFSLLFSSLPPLHMVIKGSNYNLTKNPISTHFMCNKMAS